MTNNISLVCFSFWCLSLPLYPVYHTLYPYSVPHQSLLPSLYFYLLFSIFLYLFDFLSLSLFRILSLSCILSLFLSLLPLLVFLSPLSLHFSGKLQLFTPSQQKLWLRGSLFIQYFVLLKYNVMGMVFLLPCILVSELSLCLRTGGGRIIHFIQFIFSINISPSRPVFLFSANSYVITSF